MGKWFVIFAASSWGFLALFVKKLTEFGFNEMEIVTARVLVGGVWMSLFMLIQSPRAFVVRPKHIPLFIGTGILSIVFFNWCYFSAMNELSVSLAAVLLYTSPAFVIIFSALWLKESLTVAKVMAVLITMAGSALIAFSDGFNADWNVTGLLLGLGAAIGYALYSIFGKLALKHYSANTVTFYTFIAGLFCLLPFNFFFTEKIGLEAWGWIIGLGLIPTALAYTLYTIGLEKMESGTAAVLATVEPVAAVIVGVFLFDESL
ncbi:MAG TPA: EamA family transporter, partial [Chondromyces sp.]|nr:EamA family transporter [Chondromyces sp.]